MKKSVIRTTLGVIGILGLFCTSQAQDFRLSEEHRAALKKLEFLVGTWEGEAWSIMPNQPKETLTQSEVVSWDLDGSILVIKGLGKKMDPETREEAVVHQALAILSYDPQQKSYRFNTYVADGRSSSADAFIKDTGEFVWITEAGNGYKIRYTIKLNDAGQWTEVGEWSRDEENWRQFFGMTLDRVK
jgi:hypothetical protein